MQWQLSICIQSVYLAINRFIYPGIYLSIILYLNYPDVLPCFVSYVVNTFNTAKRESNAKQ